MDGNEKLRPWGFYVHGCVDGHSRRVLYLQCTADKRSKTVGRFFRRAVAELGWPSRVRGDFGTENNQVEDLMNEHWGLAHQAFLRGRYVSVADLHVLPAGNQKHVLCQIGSQRPY